MVQHATTIEIFALLVDELLGLPSAIISDPPTRHAPEQPAGNHACAATGSGTSAERVSAMVTVPASTMRHGDARSTASCGRMKSGRRAVT